ncbi:YukJ family protein [Bacillus cereus]|nr:YukJ family protein [Bacillus cereus]
MPINYGVLKGHVTGYTLPDPNDPKPHLHVKIKDNRKTRQVIINTFSHISPSELLYYAGEDFHSDQITHLPDLEYGFTSIGDTNSNIALDYIRGNLLDRCKMMPLPPTAPGEDNDLLDKLLHYMLQAKNNPEVDIYAYGEKIPPGIHDVHMNQGNVERHRPDDGIWQDGGVLLHFKNTNKWVAIFLAFQSQSWCTDDEGHATNPVEECNHKSGC